MAKKTSSRSSHAPSKAAPPQATRSSVPEVLSKVKDLDRNSRPSEEASSDLNRVHQAVEVLAGADARYFDVFGMLVKAAADLARSPLGKHHAELNHEIQKHKAETERAERLAKAEVDRALAERIRTAQIVVVVERFGATGKDHAGVNADGTNTKIGIAAEGQKVLARKVVLKGFVGGTPATRPTHGRGPRGKTAKKT